MTRLDMTTREWHGLIKPVISHAGTDKEMPEYHVVRLDLGPEALYAVATDRYTLAAERWQLPRDARGVREQQPVHLAVTELAASLKLFRFDKDSDPVLSITIDTTSIPISVVGTPGSIRRLAVTVQQVKDGTRLVLHDHREPSRDPLASWRRRLHAVVTRPEGRALEGLPLYATQLARWASATGPGERLTVYTGPEPGDPLLITVERHFAGLWAVQQYLDGPRKTLAELPWRRELDPGDEPDADLDPG